MPDLNYIAILVAAIISVLVGFIWYSPALFGDMWMELSGLDKSDIRKMNKKMGPRYATYFLASLVMAYVLGHFINFMDVRTAAEGAEAAFWIWLGFVATVMLGIVLWEGKPVKLYLISAGYQLVSLVLMGVVLAVW